MYSYESKKEVGEIISKYDITLEDFKILGKGLCSDYMKSLTSRISTKDENVIELCLGDSVVMTLVVGF